MSDAGCGVGVEGQVFDGVGGLANRTELAVLK